MLKKVCFLLAFKGQFENRRRKNLVYLTIDCAGYWLAWRSLALFKLDVETAWDWRITHLLKVLQKNKMVENWLFLYIFYWFKVFLATVFLLFENLKIFSSVFLWLYILCTIKGIDSLIISCRWIYWFIFWILQYLWELLRPPWLKIALLIWLKILSSRKYFS